MSWYTLPCWSEKAALSEEKRKEVKLSFEKRREWTSTSERGSPGVVVVVSVKAEAALLVSEVFGGTTV